MPRDSSETFSNRLGAVLDEVVSSGPLMPGNPRHYRSVANHVAELALAEGELEAAAEVVADTINALLLGLGLMGVLAPARQSLAAEGIKRLVSGTLLRDAMPISGGPVTQSCG